VTYMLQVYPFYNCAHAIITAFLFIYNIVRGFFHYKVGGLFHYISAIALKLLEQEFSTIFNHFSFRFFISVVKKKKEKNHTT
jgi:hypothetical protein